MGLRVLIKSCSARRHWVSVMGESGVIMGEWHRVTIWLTVWSSVTSYHYCTCLIFEWLRNAHPTEDKTTCRFYYNVVAQKVKNPPAVWETWVRSLGWEDALEEGMAAHSSMLAWTEEPGRLQSLKSQGVGYDWVTKHKHIMSLGLLEVICLSSLGVCSWGKFSCITCSLFIRISCPLPDHSFWEQVKVSRWLGHNRTDSLLALATITSLLLLSREVLQMIWA